MRSCHRVTSLLVVLGALICAVQPGGALAGPNAGGTLVVHEVGLNSTCDPWVSSPVPACAEVDNNLDLDFCPTWKVYAAFPNNSQPRLRSVSWGISWNQAYLYVHATSVGNASEVTTPDWPAPGSGITLTYDPVRTAPMNELTCFIFAFYSYVQPMPGEIWSTIPHPSAPTVFTDDSTPPVEDEIAGYGTIGFGVPGFTPCPQEPTPSVETRWGRIKALYR